MSLRQCNMAARYGGPGLLLGLVLAWSIGGQRGLHAQATAPSPLDRARPVSSAPVGEAGGTLAMISPLQAGSPSATGQLLYLIDTKSRAFAVYRIDPAHDKGTIKLEGVRQYHWDMKLSQFNNQDPEVAVIESAVKAAGVPNH
ncbi:MAG: hypothetical protein P4L84_28395 [Isosphaeraceae bacterium]|nr:hypothetical protein [Isosphaeraceae bacterium]